MVLSKQYNKKIIQLLKPYFLQNDETIINANYEFSHFYCKNIFKILSENIFEKKAEVVHTFCIPHLYEWSGPIILVLYKILNIYIIIELDHAHNTEYLWCDYWWHNENRIKYMDTVTVQQYAKVYGLNIKNHIINLILRSVSFKTLEEANSYFEKQVNYYKTFSK